MHNEGPTANLSSQDWNGGCYIDRIRRLWSDAKEELIEAKKIAWWIITHASKRTKKREDKVEKVKIQQSVNV